MKNLHLWIKENPLKACLFSIALGILPTWAAVRGATIWSFLIWQFGLACIVIVAVTRKSVPILLALSILWPVTTKAEEKPAGVAIVAAAVVVVVVGGVVIFKTVQFCDKHFPRQQPPPTNAPPSELDANDYWAGAATYTAIGQCYEPQQTSSLLHVEQSATVFELEGGFNFTDDGWQFRITGAQKHEEPDASVDLNEFQRELAAWGIRIGTGGETCYALNSRPCPAGDVPLAFPPSSGQNPTVDVSWGENVQTVVFEKSSNLVDWSPMVTMTISAEQKVRFSDAAQQSQAFYRCRPL